jgi:dihydrofolate synthase / folylpolyglutamate synthase
MGRYQDALTYIFSYVNYEKVPRYNYSAVTFDLSRMESLLERLGRPQDHFRSVHIAGTKGKGSTAATVEAVLRAAGNRTGLYTSPHLHTFRERIRLGGELISKHCLVDLVDRCRTVIETTPGITAFEVMTALAFLFFAENNVDWAVLEVGLGGRLDATNVVHPAVCGITSLSYDHVELLGHTLSLIAWEKAGIIKAGVPVVSAPQMSEAMGVIHRVCADTGARLVTVGEDWTWEALGENLTGQTLTVCRTGDGLTYPELHINLLGRHQLVNATTGVALLQELADQGVSIGEDALRSGMSSAKWPGRFEVLQTHPAVVLDSAHNADSAAKLLATLNEVFPQPTYGRLAIVFGASSDKDIEGMLRTFLTADGRETDRTADKVIVTKSAHPRAVDPAHLADQVRSNCATCPISVHDDIDGALTEALAWAKPQDVICVTGSIFVVARARQEWAARHPEAFPPSDWVFEDETIGAEPDENGDSRS